jgi:hypothetical protein
MMSVSESLAPAGTEEEEEEEPSDAEPYAKPGGGTVQVRAQRGWGLAVWGRMEGVVAGGE